MTEKYFFTDIENQYITANVGFSLKTISNHAKVRAAERNISRSKMIDVLVNGTLSKNCKVTKNGMTKSVTLGSTTIVVSLDGVIVTMKTDRDVKKYHRKMRNKYRDSRL